MKSISIFLICSWFASCGLFKSYKNLSDKGYDIRRDTIDIKPYEYLIIHKGYTPQQNILHPINTLNVKISITGYENLDTIPINSIFRNFEISLSDTSVALVDGELRFSRHGYGFTLLLGKKDCPLSYSHLKENQKIIKTNDVLFFWNVTVSRNGIHYTIPARKYLLK